MQLIIVNDGSIKKVNPTYIDIPNKAKEFSTDPLEFLATLVPDNSIIVQEGFISEDYHDIQNHKHIDLLNQYTTYDRIIFAISNGKADKLLETCTKYKLLCPFYVAASSINYSQSKNPKIVFFAEEQLIAVYYPISNCNPTKKFSCLMANKWSHRVLTYIHLYSKPYFNEMIFGWGRRTDYTLDFLEQEDFINDIVITDKEKMKLASMPQRILAHPHDDTDFNDRSTNHIAYTDACLNIITETRSRNSTPQLTEKSYKPIIAGQFFIMIGSKGLISYIRSIGFDVFDDIINHSYDSIEDDRLRIKTAIEEIDRLNTLDLIKLHTQSKNRFVYNQTHIKSQEYLNQFPPMEFPV